VVSTCRSSAHLISYRRIRTTRGWKKPPPERNTWQKLKSEKPKQAGTEFCWYYGIESYLDAATTADDYLALAERCAKLAAYCGGVAAEIARDGDTPLMPLTKANKEWIKKLE
jgi:hypothetical protein